MVTPSTHFSIGTAEIEKTEQFFTDIIGGKVTHRSPSGYVNIDCFGAQITLTKNASLKDKSSVSFPSLHFGFNMNRSELDAIVERVSNTNPELVLNPLRVVDAGTEMERAKIFLSCPPGYMVELKGY